MTYTLHTINGQAIAEINEKTVAIHDGQQFLDIIMNQTADNVVIHAVTLGEAFFDLSSGIAGDILQKAVNYRIRLAIVGDYTGYTSKALHDFIYESNKGSRIAFVNTLEEALIKLST